MLTPKAVAPKLAKNVVTPVLVPKAPTLNPMKYPMEPLKVEPMVSPKVDPSFNPKGFVNTHSVVEDKIVALVSCIISGIDDVLMGNVMDIVTGATDVAIDNVEDVAEGTVITSVLNYVDSSNQGN